MFNPNSAIDRIKNSLSYKLGLAIIECKKQHGRGYITLPYKLYKIKQQHFKEQKLYKQTIKIFPQLAYPKVESCKDYNESIRYKYHLSYMLGEVLICAHKAWYKGGYFMLPSLLKEKYKIYKNIQDIISILPQKLHYHFYNSTIKNHKINIQDLIDVLKQHKDYKPILENIFHNFDFFVKHFDLIRIWLSSKDFKEKYKQENHPYPSLLDPKKLNDENEKINYKNIPAELAWEMNLPLPDNYKFVFLGIFGAGSDAMDKFLRHCGVKMNLRVNNNYKRYLNAYEHMLCNKNNYNAIVLSGHKVLEDSTKLFFLIQKKVPYLCIVRDPISLLKPLVNHHQGGNKRIIRHISMDFDYKTYLENVILYHNTIRNNDGLKHSFDCIPSLNNIYRYLDGNMNILNWRVKHLQHSINKIYYFDMDKIRKEHAFETFLELSQIFGFKKPTNRNFFEAKVCRNDILVLLPLNLDIKLDAYGINANKDTLEITISTRQISFLSEHYLDITHLLIGDQCYFDNIVCFCQKKDFMFLKTNQKLFFDVQKFIKNLLIMMSEQEIKEQKKMFDEDDILDYLRANSDVRNALRNIFNSDYKDLKELEPDIVASWKYYQEFERICKELDGD